MYVQMPDRAPGQPVLLPVVRMGCDTALVVIPPAKGRGATMVSATPVTPRPRPLPLFSMKRGRFFRFGSTVSSRSWNVFPLNIRADFTDSGSVNSI